MSPKEEVAFPKRCFERHISSAYLTMCNVFLSACHCTIGPTDHCGTTVYCLSFAYMMPASLQILCVSAGFGSWPSNQTNQTRLCRACGCQMNVVDSVAICINKNCLLSNDCRDPGLDILFSSSKSSRAKPYLCTVYTNTMSPLKQLSHQLLLCPFWNDMYKGDLHHLNNHRTLLRRPRQGSLARTCAIHT